MSEQRQLSSTTPYTGLSQPSQALQRFSSTVTFATNRPTTSQKPSAITMNSETSTGSRLSVNRISSTADVLVIIQEHQYYVYAISILLLLSICWLCFCLRRRRKKSIKSSVATFKSNTDSSTTETSYSTSMDSHSSPTSSFSQEQTASITLVSNELGNLILF